MRIVLNFLSIDLLNNYHVKQELIIYASPLYFGRQILL